MGGMLVKKSILYPDFPYISPMSDSQSVPGVPCSPAGNPYRWNITWLQTGSHLSVTGDDSSQQVSPDVKSHICLQPHINEICTTYFPECAVLKLQRPWKVNLFSTRLPGTSPFIVYFKTIGSWSTTGGSIFTVIYLDIHIKTATWQKKEVGQNKKYLKSNAIVLHWCWV